jgi:cytochrome P450
MTTDVSPEQLVGRRQMMLNMDVPEHARHRRLVSATFTP